jgi:hypothetical protein
MKLLAWYVMESESRPIVRPGAPRARAPRRLH